MRLPNSQTKLWNQTNREGPPRVENGRVVASMRGSFGLDQTTKLGRVSLQGALNIATNASFTNYGVNFKQYAGFVYTIAGNKIHLNDGTNYGAFAVDTAVGTPTTCDSAYSDIEVFPTTGANATLYATTKSHAVYYQTGGAWSTFNVGDVSDGPHMLCYYADRMYMTTTPTQILSFDYSRNTSLIGGANSINLPYNITFVTAASSRIWIGTINRYNQNAVIYEWDGSSPEASRSYIIESSGALSCVIKNDVPYVMDANGRLLKWNSSSFVEIARLPLDNKFLAAPLTVTSNARWIHPHGMTVSNNRIQILIGNLPLTTNGAANEFCPGGVWEYDDDLGLYHRQPISYTPTTLTITDFGQNTVGIPGAITTIRIADTSTSDVGTLFMSANYYTDATTTAAGIWINDTKSTKTNTGYIVTGELDAGGIQDYFQRGFVMFRQLLNSADKIVLKYRRSKATPTELTITWTSTTTFTTSDANMANYAVGDEVEILRGKGGGMCSHITVIALNAGTYTVTVDEVHTGASGTAVARLQKWSKAGSITADTVSDFFVAALGAKQNSGWIQFKIFMYWTGNNELHYLDVVTKPYKKPE